jgi:hypothetical protein
VRSAGVVTRFSVAALDVQRALRDAVDGRCRRRDCHPGRIRQRLVGKSTDLAGMVRASPLVAARLRLAESSSLLVVFAAVPHMQFVPSRLARSMGGKTNLHLSQRRD